MVDIILSGSVRIPGWIADMESFRRWVYSDAFPERGWFGYLAGELWVDLNPERLDHNQAKAEVRTVLAMKTKAEERGHLFGRMLVTHRGAKLATEPDLFFFTDEAWQSGQVLLEHGADSIEVLGSPDMVLEVVSPTSVQRDTVVLRDLYWRAGIREYWLVDPRGSTV